MDLGETKEWILVATSALTMLSIVGGVITFAFSTYFTLKEYRLKLEAEKRVAASQNAETDVRLIQVFTEVMNVANGRGGYEISETVVEELFKREVFSKTHFDDWKEFQKRLGEFPVIYLPVGLPSQDAAIAAAATLGLKYDVLKEPALEALEQAKQFRRDTAERHLKRLKQ